MRSYLSQCSTSVLAAVRGRQFRAWLWSERNPRHVPGTHEWTLPLLRHGVREPACVGKGSAQATRNVRQRCIAHRVRERQVPKEPVAPHDEWVQWWRVHHVAVGQRTFDASGWPSYLAVVPQPHTLPDYRPRGIAVQRVSGRPLKIHSPTRDSLSKIISIGAHALSLGPLLLLVMKTLRFGTLRHFRHHL